MQALRDIIDTFARLLASTDDMWREITGQPITDDDSDTDCVDEVSSESDVSEKDL